MGQRALPVVAGIIEDAQGRILLAQRPPGANEALRWEFPGGKIRPGESAQCALHRELIEELGFIAGPTTHFTSVHWRGGPRALNLHAYRLAGSEHALHAREHLALRWAARAQMVRFDVPAPDRPIVARLALPSRYLITPDPAGALATFLQQLSRALDAHQPGAVLLRAPGLAKAQLPYWAAAVLEHVRACLPRVLAFLHSDAALAIKLGYDGVHISSEALAKLSKRSLPQNLWLLASCHDESDLAHAERVGIDAVVLGPVNPTQSHPSARSLGWVNFARMARQTWMPVYALGGVSADALGTATASGAHGIAAIRGFWPTCFERSDASGR